MKKFLYKYIRVGESAFIPMMIKVIQKLSKSNSELMERVKELENK